MAKIQDLEAGVHWGSILRDISKTYPTFVQLLSEEVQNMVDVAPSRAEVIIDLRKDRMRITCLDNGCGTTEEDFRNSIQNIYKSQKKAGKYGQFGRGFMSPIDKCRQFVFTSAPAKNKGAKQDWPGYIKYDFTPMVTEFAKSKRGDDVTNKVPAETVDFEHNTPWWNSRVDIIDLRVMQEQLDKFNLKNFAEEMGISYGAHIRELQQSRRGLQFSVKLITDQKEETVYIVPKVFNGKPIKTFEGRGTNCGRVKINLFFKDNPINARDLVVEVGDKTDFRVSWMKISAQSLQAEKSLSGQIFMDQDARETLDTGHFEGLIWVEDCQWNEERIGLVQNEALMDFYIILTDWIRKEAMPMIQKARLKDRQTMREQVSLEARSILDQMFEALPERMRDIYKALSSAPGMVTTEHSKVKVDSLEHPVVRTREGDSRSGTSEGHPNSPAKKHREDVIHVGTAVTGGTPRLISKQEKGLVFECVNFDQNPDRFAQGKHGMILVSYNHPDFARCEAESADRLREYIVSVVMFAACLFCQPEEKQYAFEQFQDMYLSMNTSRLIATGKKKTKKK